MTTAYTTMPSPVGELLLTGTGDCLTGVSMPGHRHPGGRRGHPELGPGAGPAGATPGARRDDAPFADARRQLEEYFAGARTAFDLPLAAPGTPFQELVWDELRRVGYGETISYGELAARIERPGSARAVGAANGANPISIIIPCHRVIGSAGSLTGYGGGLEAKRRLLALERAPA